MSGNDDRDLPGPDGQDAAVARAWRRASDEQPPSRLDDAIVAAARAAAKPGDARADAGQHRPRPRSRWLKWQPLLAAASVAGLAFVLLQLRPLDRDVAPAPRAVEQAPVAAGESDGRGPSVRSPSAVPAPVTAAVPTARSAVEEAASTKAAAPALTQSLGDAQEPGAADRADRAARIAALHAAGDEAGAADALRAFRAAEPHADDYLPESLRDWARTIE
jgi:hypothetical protein